MLSTWIANEQNLFFLIIMIEGDYKQLFWNSDFSYLWRNETILYFFYGGIDVMAK